MKKRAKEVPKERVLTASEIRVLWHAIGDRPLYDSVASALRFVLLTGLRPGEAAGAALAELKDVGNGARACLDTSAQRMKTRRSHVAPLTPMALQIVKGQLSRAVEGQAHLFPSTFAARSAIARHSLWQALKRLIHELKAEGPDAEVVESLKANPPTPQFSSNRCHRSRVARRLAGRSPGRAGPCPGGRSRRPLRQV